MRQDHKHRGIFALIVLLIQSGCIERYFPDDEELKTGTVVIVAHLSDKPGEQTIQISRTSTIRYPQYDPMLGCLVEVLKLNGESREFVEATPGYYTCFLDEQFLETGRQFALVVITSEGERYESEYEELHPAVDINAVYWEREKRHTSNLEEVLDGIQFYTDFRIDKAASNCLRWELEETYEIHNPDYKSYMVNMNRMTVEAPDTSVWRTCWITKRIQELYTLDLGLVEGEDYLKLPLNYVSNQSRRLFIAYSLLVRQYSMSESAFRYWDELGKNLQARGKLFDQQPALTTGNICNINEENELVLGYFSMSGITEKRIQVNKIPDLKIEEDPGYCFPDVLPAKWNMLVANYPKSYLPVYLSYAKIGEIEQFGPVKKCCVDCREYKGSTHIKPDFW